MTAGIVTRQAAVLTSLSLLLASVAIASHCYYRGAREAALDAGDSLVECRRLASDILRLRQRPNRARLAAQPVLHLTEQIEREAGAAGIPRDKLLRIHPSEPHRMEGTAYLRQLTRIDVRQVDLSSFTQLLSRLETADDSQAVDGLRLRISRHQTQDGQLELWDAEITLASLIYAPMPASQR